MNFHSRRQNPFLAEIVRTAALGPSHGYRFDGDTVHLNAMFTVTDAGAHRQQWALQLWACPEAPVSAQSIRGQKVAEVALPPIGEVADDTEGFELATQATTPAGGGEHHMVLVLASARDGRFDDLQDFTVYPCTEQFHQLTLGGTSSFSISGDQVRISVERIENPRSIGSQSGHLALELWALAAPYEGGAFQGSPLAGVAFDGLAGQWDWTHLDFELPYVAPPAGAWHAVLMLREWTAAGYVTRDFSNFPIPLVIEAPDREVVREAAVSTNPAAPPVKNSAGKAATATPVKKSAAKTKASDSLKAPKALETPKPLESPKTPETAKPLKAAKAKSKPSTVSVNEASRDELKGVKGLPGKVVEEILRSRPFKSLEDLLSCKGMGAKLLSKLRDKLSI